MSRRLLLSVILVIAALAALPLAADADAGLVANSDAARLIKVCAPDAKASNRFGQASSISGETMVVVADGEGSEDSGLAAYVFIRSAEGWTLQQRMTLPSQPQCVAIDGDTLAVGLDGRVQVWTRAGSTWTLQAELSGFGTKFVNSIAIDGDTAAVGASFDVNDEGGVPGSVFVFVRDGVTWTLQQTLASGVSGEDRFGGSVSLQGDRLAVGAPWESRSVRCVGAAYIFERTASNWAKTARLVAPTVVAFDTLAGHVALSGDSIAVSQTGWSSQTGAVWTWNKDNTGWHIGQHITAPDGEPGNLVDYGGDGFGAGMALAGDTMVVGAPEDDDRASNAGALYVLRNVGGRWVHQRKITAPDGTANDYFGTTIGVDDGRATVGMSGEDGATRDEGAVYAFDLGFVTPVDTTLTVDARGILVNDNLPAPASVTAFANSAPAHGTLAMAQDSSFAYTPSAGWRGSDVFEYACTDGVATSNAASVTVQTWQPTKLGLTPVYSGSSTLRAKLTTVKGAPVVGRTVIFEVRSGYKWVSVGTATSDANGFAARKLVSLKTAHTYRVRTPFSTLYGAAGSSHVRVAPKVTVSVPTAPTWVR